MTAQLTSATIGYVTPYAPDRSGIISLKSI